MAKISLKVFISIIFVSVLSVLVGAGKAAKGTRSERYDLSIAEDKFMPDHGLPELYVQFLERHLDYTESQWHEYSANEQAFGYFGRGSCDDRGIRTASDYAYVYAFLYSYSPMLKSSPTLRATVLDHALQTIRYLTSSHVALYKTQCALGSQWGLVWQSALWSTRLGMAAWLLWDEMDAAMQAEVFAVLAAEAELIASRVPPYKEYINTQAEENGWDSNIVSLASSMFPADPRASSWDLKAKEFMMNTLSVQDDLTDARIVEGRPVSDWVYGANLHPDFTVENHGFFHPVYNMVPLSELGNSALAYAFGGQSVPVTAEHHVIDVWNNVLKAIILTDSEWIYPNGLDWMIHDYEHISLLAYLSTYFDDPLAAHYEQLQSQYIERRQALQNDGSFFGDLNDLAELRESVQAARFADSYLYHRYFDSQETVNAPGNRFELNQLGTRHFVYTGIVLHRTQEKVTSFSWLNRIMGVVVPNSNRYLESPYVTLPYEQGLVGSRSVEGREPISSLITYTVELLDDWLTTTGEVSENEDTVAHFMSFTSLPGRSVVYLEQIIAKEPIIVESERGIPQGIEMDAMSGITRTLHSKNGSVVMGGNEIVSLPGTWVNLDDRLGMVVKGGNGIRFGDSEPRKGAIQKMLVGSYDASPSQYDTGEQIANRAALVQGDASHELTRLAAENFIQVSLAEGWSAVLVNEPLASYLVASNFFGRAVTTTITTEFGGPILPGDHRVDQLGTHFDIELESNTTGVWPVAGYLNSQSSVNVSWNSSDNRFTLMNLQQMPVYVQVSHLIDGGWITQKAELKANRLYYVSVTEDGLFINDHVVSLPIVIDAAGIKD